MEINNSKKIIVLHLGNSAVWQNGNLNLIHYLNTWVQSL